jgi:hypothetical protein
VSEPSPQFVPTSSVSSSAHDRSDFASGTTKPSRTNERVRVSNSRQVEVSPPPRDISTMQRRYSGDRHAMWPATQFSRSSFASASKSISGSHCGLLLR